jgi:hypothetical protein
MTLHCVVFNKNEIYLPISLICKLSSDFGLLSKMKFNLEDLYQAVYFDSYEKNTQFEVIIWFFCY